MLYIVSELLAIEYHGRERDTVPQDPVLVEQCLQENAYDPDLAIVELLQLMQLTDGTRL